MSVKKVKYLVLLLLTSVLCLVADGGTAGDISGDLKVNLDDFAELSCSWDSALPWSPDQIPQRLIAYWPLDRDAQDNQSDFHGQIYGDPAWLNPRDSAVGISALRMNGQDYIEINHDDFPALNFSFAIDLWIRTSGSQEDQAAVSRGDSSWQLGIEAQSGVVFFKCDGLSPANYLQGQTDLTDNLWHHISGVYDHKQQKIIIYVDGWIDAEGTASGTVGTGDKIWIGGNPGNDDLRNWWHGDLDNIRIFNYATSHFDIFQRKTFHVDQSRGSNGNSGQGRQNAFKTIQHAIDTADDGDLIWVWPGTYQEPVLFWEYKSLTIKSISDAAVIKAPGDYAVSFYSGSSGTSLENFVICDSEIGIFTEAGSPTLRFLTIVNNDYGIESYNGSNPKMDHCIFWNNKNSDIYNSYYIPDVSYSCIERPIADQNNICQDPLFADPNTGDYHLLSDTGRYLVQDPNNHNPGPGNWAIDEITSPCIDAGNADLNPMGESMSNGGRVNIGAFGNTKYASKSSWPYPADLDFNGHVWWEDFQNFVENWLYCQQDCIIEE